MKFLADINIPQSVITSLIKADYDVLDIKKIRLNLKDIELIQIAKQEKRVILTRDKDFLILKIQTPDFIQKRLMQLLENQDENILNKSLTIIREDSADSHPY